MKVCDSVKHTPVATLQSTGEDEERAKFDQLWDVKTVEQGRVRISPKMLDDLIRKESIDKFYIVEDKPVAR